MWLLFSLLAPASHKECVLRPSRIAFSEAAGSDHYTLYWPSHIWSYVFNSRLSNLRRPQRSWNYFREEQNGEENSKTTNEVVVELWRILIEKNYGGYLQIGKDSLYGIDLLYVVSSDADLRETDFRSWKEDPLLGLNREIALGCMDTPTTGFDFK